LSKTEHDNIVEFKVSGDLALFADVLTRPGGEKFSYPIPTYEALEADYHMGDRRVQGDE